MFTLSTRPSYSGLVRSAAGSCLYRTFCRTLRKGASCAFLNALGVLITKSILSKWHKTGRPPHVAFRTEKRGLAFLRTGPSHGPRRRIGNQPGPRIRDLGTRSLEAFCQRSLVVSIYKRQTIVEFLFRCRKSNRPDPIKERAGRRRRPGPTSAA
jgi:hypothetical protein